MAARGLNESNFERPFAASESDFATSGSESENSRRSMRSRTRSRSNSGSIRAVGGGRNESLMPQGMSMTSPPPTLPRSRSRSNSGSIHAAGGGRAEWIIPPPPPPPPPPLSRSRSNSESIKASGGGRVESFVPSPPQTSSRSRSNSISSLSSRSVHQLPNTSESESSKKSFKTRSKPSMSSSSRHRRRQIDFEEESDFEETSSQEERRNMSMMRQRADMRRNAERIAENRRRQNPPPEAATEQPPEAATEQPPNNEPAVRRSARVRLQQIRQPNLEHLLAEREKNAEIAQHFDQDMEFLNREYNINDFEELRGNETPITEAMIERFEVAWNHRFQTTSTYSTIYNYALRKHLYNRKAK